MPVSTQVLDNPTDWVADHIRRYVESGGTRGHRFHGRDALLLTTRGRRTGNRRRTALYYGRDSHRARPASAGERPRLWSLMLGVFPKYASYERAASRDLPVVVVERR